MKRTTMPRQPNVLVFFTDQQRWDSVGRHGNPLDLTPNFDLLSARMPVPCWGRLPHAPDIDAGQLSRHIAIPL